MARIEIDDAEDARTALFELIFADVEQEDFKGMSDDVDMKYRATEVFYLSNLILDNESISGCGSEGEVEIVREKRDEAFRILEMLTSKAK